ncbi:MAG: hypothetical protein ACRCVT_04280 [Leadbetterella sp.]
MKFILKLILLIKNEFDLESNMPHVISGFGLGVFALSVFIFLYRKLPIETVLLLEAWFLSLFLYGIASGIAYVGYKTAFYVSDFFVSIAFIVGGLGLVIGSIHLFRGKAIHRYTSYLVLGCGFLFFILIKCFSLKSIFGISVLRVEYFATHIWLLGLILISLILLFKKEILSSVCLTMSSLMGFLVVNRFLVFDTGFDILDISNYLLMANVFFIGLAFFYSKNKQS